MKLICVDLGDRQDYTAIAVLEVIEHTMPRNKDIPGSPQQYFDGLERVYDVVIRFLERMPLGGGYPKVIERIKTIANHPIIAGGKFVLLVDATGVGVPVIQNMRENDLKPIGIMITGGVTESLTDLGFTVPKRELVSALQLLFQSRRLKIPTEIEYKSEFVEELQNFKVKINEKAHETFGAGKEDVHDDLVIAVSMGAWYISRTMSSRKIIRKPRFKDDKGGKYSINTGLYERYK